MSARKNRTRLWHALHGWLVLPLWVFLLFVCLSGTVAVIGREILWLADPAVRAQPGPELSPNQLVTAVEATSGGRVMWLQRAESYLAAQIRLARPDGSMVNLWVDPASGAIQGQGNGGAFLHFLRALHGWLLLPKMGGISIGWYAVSLTALPLLGTLITGLLVYKRFWRAFTRPSLRLGAGARVVWGDLHRLGGVWSLWFILLMGVTGLWFLVQAVIVNTGGSLGQNRPLGLLARDSLPRLAEGQAIPRADLDMAVRAAQAAVPGLEPIRIVLPTSGLEPVTIIGAGPVPLLADSVAIHPFSGAVVGVQRGGDQPPLLMAARMLKALHVGAFGGPVTKALWFAFGLVLSGLVLSGLMVWMRRTAATREQARHA